MGKFVIQRAKYISYWVLVFIISLPFTSVLAKDSKLKVFASTGLDKPLSELATMYVEKNGINIEIIAGAVSKDWILKAQKTGDIIVCGAEYQLNQIISTHPQLIDTSSRTSLTPRMTGLLVRKGSQKKIASFSDLGTAGIQVMVVDGADQTGLWEDMTAKRDMIAKLQKNIIVSAKSNAEAIELWNTRRGLDAWITFQSWHHYMKDSTRLIKVLDHYKRFRGTPVAVINASKKKDQAKQFIEFLKSKGNLKTYQKWGW
jgi:accessory colonization factor AcfC